MKLKAPKQITFWIAVAIAVLGIIAKLVAIPVLTAYAGWLVILALVVLVAGDLIKGL
jgi:membrane protein YdbS with pleckstrin-like domain